MLSIDRSEHRADHLADRWADHRADRWTARRRPAPRGEDALWDDAQPFDPDAPWDDETAEALTSLCESEEGRLWRPADGDRARAPQRLAGDGATETQDGDAGAEGLDRAWLESHLSGLVQRLQATLAEASPERTLAALTDRLESIEQHFSATLGRVAQRTDLDGLRAIETRVLDLAAQLEQARERLDRIGGVDDEVRTLARRIEEAGTHRTSGLERLLRDCIAEWREGEQRTAAALQHIEEAIGRLGESIDAMEAAKPAPDLTVSPLTGTELAIGGAGTALLPGGDGSTPPLYRPPLDAADYAPKPVDGARAAAAGAFLPQTGEPPARQDAMDWLPDSAATTATRPAAVKLTPGALRIKALRARLRQSGGRRRAGLSYGPAAAFGEPGRIAIKRASLSVLLMAGAALAAGSAFFLYETLVTPAPASPVRVAPGGGLDGAKSDLKSGLDALPKG